MTMARGDREDGFSLIELFIVMSLLALALSLFGNTLFAMQRSSGVQEEMGRATDELMVAFSELERQVRAAYCIYPEVAGDEIQLYTVNASGTKGWVAWRVKNSRLERSENNGPWRIVGTGDPTSADPGPIFVNAAQVPPVDPFTPEHFVSVNNPNDYSTPYSVASRLKLDFWVLQQGGPAVEFKSVLTARNVPRRGTITTSLPC